MSYKRNDEDVKRLAEVIFTARMVQVKVPPSWDGYKDDTAAERAVDKLVDQAALLSWKGAEAFCLMAEGWLGDVVESE